MQKFNKFGDLPKNKKKYTKRPVTIEAVQISEPFEVETLEADNQKGKAGDYLIKGIKGELYPCDKNIFHKTYDGAQEVEWVDAHLDVNHLISEDAEDRSIGDYLADGKYVIELETHKKRILFGLLPNSKVILLAKKIDEVINMEENSENKTQEQEKQQPSQGEEVKQEEQQAQPEEKKEESSEDKPEEEEKKD